MANAARTEWKQHVLRVRSREVEEFEQVPEPTSELATRIEPWLAALLQSEHVSLLAGSGLTTAIALQHGQPVIDMELGAFSCPLSEAVLSAATEIAERSGRGEPNFEDGIRAARDLIAGLDILARRADKKSGLKAAEAREAWSTALNDRIRGHLKAVLMVERGIREGMTEQPVTAQLLGSFLLAFASRPPTRERLHIFTTNYDRLIEYGCDLLGLRLIDRFVGSLEPVFRGSRLAIDLHYNPPGIRGEPRYLEGVARLTKLHGSIDWRAEADTSGGPAITRVGVPFGAVDDHPDLPENALDHLLIYPNPAKDSETLEYPYADLFRDFAAAVCRPNSVVFTYGYGFGDDHINRILRDMLTIPSSHLAILSFDGAGGRIQTFCERVGRPEQVTLLVGPHFAELETLVGTYLPRPAIERTTWKMVELLKRRGEGGRGEEPADGPEHEA